QGYLSYFAQPENANLQDYLLAGIVFKRAQTHEDGSYRVAGMPGPGFIAVDYMHNYLLAPERDDEFAIKEPFFPTVPLHPMNYSAMARIDAPKGAESVQRDVTLDPGWTITGTVLGPDGKPLAGVWGIGLENRDPAWSHRKVTKTAE